MFLPGHNQHAMCSQVYHPCPVLSYHDVATETHAKNSVNEDIVPLGTIFKGKMKLTLFFGQAAHRQSPIPWLLARP